jgi:copper resistance protein B
MKPIIDYVRPAATLLLTVGALTGSPDLAGAQNSQILTFFQADQLEYRIDDGPATFTWDAQGWVGGDYNRAWLKSEGDYLTDDGIVENAEIQLLYSRSIAAFWDLQIGGRYDPKPDPSRGFAVIGIQGLAPYFFEVDVAGFVSDDGDVSARLEAEYELLFTQRLIAQPRVEMNFAVQEVEELGIGSGLSDVELGLRLRYEIVREFAPYIGVAWERKVGKTADFAREEGEDVDNLWFVVGVRFWF